MVTHTEPTLQGRFVIDPDHMDEDPDFRLKDRYWRWWARVRETIQSAARPG